MLFVLYVVDNLNSESLRAQNRHAHLAHVEKFKNHVVIAGPLLDAGGSTSRGGLYILDFPDRVAAEAFVADDPHVKAGLFCTIALWPFRKSIG